jgi:type I restriction enzyme S subunit
MSELRSLPVGWHWASFGSVARVASHLVDPATYPNLPHIAPNHIQSGTGVLLSYTTVADDGVTSPKHLFRPGQVLYSKIRPYLAKAILVNFSGLCSADMYPLDTSLNPSYLLYWLISPEFTHHATRFQGRTVLPKINRQQLEQLPVPVPPGHMQHLISASIEEQFSRIDVGVAAIQRAQRNVARLAKSVILSAIPEVYPDGWKRVTVGEAGEVSLGRQRAPKYHKGPNMRPYLRVANVFEDRIDTTDVMSMHFDDDEFSFYALQPGDILLNEGQSPDLLGRPAMYRGDPPGLAFTKSLLRFRAGPSVLPAWALLVFRRRATADCRRG